MAMLLNLAIDDPIDLCNEKLEHGRYVRFISDVIIDPNQADVIYAAEAFGVYKSIDGGATWKSAAGGLYETISALAISTENSKIVFAVIDNRVSDNKIYRSDNGGDTWRSVFSVDLDDRGRNFYSEGMIFQNKNSIYAILGNNIYKSVDNGMEWAVFKKKCGSMASDIKNPKILYAGCQVNSNDQNGIYKSTDNGSTWSLVLYTTATITTLSVDNKNTQIIYAGTRAQGVFRSMDGGKQWHTLKDGLPPESIRALAIDSIHSNIIYVGTSNGVFKSTDSGLRWNKIGKGLPDYNNVNTLAIDPQNTNILYIGTQFNGVFKSIDGGENWEPVNRGISCWQGY